jgi:Mg-chelatase subunit ChlD
MFKSFQNSQSNISVESPTYAMVNSIDAMDITSDTGSTRNEDSFVHVAASSTIPNQPQPSLSLKVLPHHEVIGIGNTSTKSTQFCATVTARDLPPDNELARAPVDIIVVLDVSGSMNGSKLELCKTTLSLLLRELSSSDRFGLVSFGSDAKLEIPPKKLNTQTDKDSALSKINSIRSRGHTNISGGIAMAAQEMKSLESPNEVQTIFLLTDGKANRGVFDKEGIVKLTKGCLGITDDDGQSSIAVHCFGYGSHHDREMLRDISTATEGGTYYYVDNDSNVSSSFGDALGGVLSVVAQNAVVSLKVPQESAVNGVSILDVKHDKAVKQADGSYIVSLNDFYAEESRDIIFEVVLSNECNSAQVAHVISSMSYVDIIHSKIVQTENFLGCVSRPNGKEVSPSDPHVSMQCIRIKATEVIAETETMANSGNLDNAKRTLNSYIDKLEKEIAVLDPLKSNPFFIQIMYELNNIMQGFSSRITYETEGAMYLQSRLMSHTMQRCSESVDGSESIYRSPGKQWMATKMKNESLKF